MKKEMVMLLLLVMMVTGCSQQQSVDVQSAPVQQEIGKQEDQPKQEEAPATETAATLVEEPPAREALPPLKRELTAFELSLANQPIGKYAGENYDEQKINQELDKLPADLSADQYLQELLKLMGEDYRPHIVTFANFDSSVEVELARPTEDIMLPEDKRTHFALLIDASGSMKGKVGGKTKMAAAKEAIDQFSAMLPKNATISLRVYGHKGSGSDQDKALSCGSTEVFYSQAGYEAKAFGEALAKIEPAGWTPIAKALEAVQQDIPPNTTETIVYVVSDGIETCGGNAVEAAKMLGQSNIHTVVNIIGFDVDNDGQRMLKQVADAGKGVYITVQDEKALKKYLRGEYDKLKMAWYEWKEKGKAQALDMKEEKKKLANDTKDKIKVMVEEEKQRLLRAREYLKQRFNRKGGIMDTDTAIIDRKQQIWQYAVDVGNGLWRESVDSGNGQWREIIKEGNKGARDAIEKRDSQ